MTTRMTSGGDHDRETGRANQHPGLDHPEVEECTRPQEDASEGRTRYPHHVFTANQSIIYVPVCVFDFAPQNTSLTPRATDSPDIYSHKVCVTTGGLDTIDPSNDWVMDSGCTTHICNNKDLFSELHGCKTTIATAGTPLRVTQKGTAQATFSIFDTTNNTITEQPWTFTDTLYVPNCPLNLLSVSKLDKSFYISTERDRKSTRLNSSHSGETRMPSSA